MNANIGNAGFVRITDLMLRLMDASQNQHKETIVNLSETFADDCGEFIGVMMRQGKVTTEEFQRFSTTDAQVEQMLKTAASARQIRQGAGHSPLPTIS